MGNVLPPHPDLVLRIGFAGTRMLPDDPAARQTIEDAVRRVYSLIAERIVDLRRPDPAADTTPKVVEFYSTNEPCIRLISGLDQGADDLAARVLADMAARQPGVRWETAGVLAFPHDAYRDSREAAFQVRFDALYQACVYSVELDGIHDASGSVRNQRAYRAQTTVLLRQADLFVAVADASAKGKPGGTHEAVRAALAFGLPVVFIDAATGATRVMEPGESADDILGGGFAGSSVADLRAAVRLWVTMQAADPDIVPGDRDPNIHITRAGYGEGLLTEFFQLASVPPLWRGKDRLSLRKALWRLFEKRFKPPADGGASSAPAPTDLRSASYEPFRARASGLSRHYAALYRGAFLVNYALAVAAVTLATVSLVVLAEGDARHGLLLGLGLAKLAIVAGILINTHQANHRGWNERAVDFRYLAERFRALSYLPLAGSFEPPAPGAPSYSSRVVRQSAVDWLFDAIVRHVSPASLGPKDRHGPVVLAIDPGRALNIVRDHWLLAQFRHHRDNAFKMKAVFVMTGRLGRRLNQVVIGVVLLDILLLFFLLLDAVPHAFHAATHGVTLLLVFLAVVLPAAVAALNAVRFQTECRRLAERSDVMVDTIDGRLVQATKLDQRIAAARNDPATDPGSWTPDVLRFTESVATEMVDEVAEWSVLYAKGGVPET